MLFILTTYGYTYNNKQVITSTLQLDVNAGQSPQADNENRSENPDASAHGTELNRWSPITRLLKGLFGLGS